MDRVALKTGLMDLAAVSFVVGGIASFVTSLLTVPLFSVGFPASFVTVFLVILVISVICSFGAVHCYTLATKRMLSKAGMRGLIFGALLLVLSLEFVGSFALPINAVVLAEVSAILVLVGGIICFALRYSDLSFSPLTNQ
jgi:hypothetical protein